MSSSIRVAIRRVSSASVAFARRSAAPRVAVRFGAVAGLTAAAATTTTTSSGPSVAVTNSRERSVAHVTSASHAAVAPVAAVKPVHWAADADGINAQQRAMAKLTSSDPLERLSSAGTRELLQAAYEAPGVVTATLARDSTATHSVAAAAEEQQFLKKMEAEYGADVIPILRRQEWTVHLAAADTSAARTNDTAATLVCYFQEGTQRILFKRLSLVQ